MGSTGENATRLLDQDAMHDRLTRLRRRTEILLDTLPAMVLSVDRDRKLHYANRRARAVLGISSRDRGGLAARLARTVPSPRSAPGPLRGDLGARAPRRRLGGRDPHRRPRRGRPVVEHPAAPGRGSRPKTRPLFRSWPPRSPISTSPNKAPRPSNPASPSCPISPRPWPARSKRSGFWNAISRSVSRSLPMKALLLYRPLAGQQRAPARGRRPAREPRSSSTTERGRSGGKEHPCVIAFQTGVPRSAEVSDVVSPNDAALLGAEHDIRHFGFLPLLAAGRSSGSWSRPRACSRSVAADDMDLMTQIGFLLGGTIYVAQLVRELNEQRAVAFEASRLKSEFLANTSHELRTPLTAILGFLRLVIDGTIDDVDKQREYLTIAHDSAEKLLTIINDVLDLAKIEAGRLEVHQGPVPVRAVLEGVETLFKHQMKNKGVKFTLSSDQPGSRCVGRSRSHHPDPHQPPVQRHEVHPAQRNHRCDLRRGRTRRSSSPSPTAVSASRRARSRRSFRASIRSMAPPPGSTAAPGSA